MLISGPSHHIGLVVGKSYTKFSIWENYSVAMARSIAGDVMCCAIITAGSLFTYLPLFEGEWEFITQWDDNANFVNNDMMKEPLSLPSVMKMWSESIINVYEPLSWITKGIVISLFGLNSQNIRILGLLFHTINSCILMFITERLLYIGSNTGSETSSLRVYRRLCALVSSLIFAVHPANVETVAWASCQSYTLACFFSLLSIFCYLEEQQHYLDAPIPHDASVSSSPRWGTLPHGLRRVLSTPALVHVPSALLYCCAVLSKSAAITMVVVFPLLDLYRARPDPVELVASLTSRSGIGAAVGYVRHHLVGLVCAVLLLGLTLRCNSSGQHEDSDTFSLSVAARVWKLHVVLLLYVVRAVWPVGLRPHYKVLPRDMMWSVDWAELGLDGAAMESEPAQPQRLSLGVSVALVWVCVLGVAAQLLADSSRREGGGGGHRGIVGVCVVGYYVATVLPTCGLVQHGVVTLAADRYMLLPLLLLPPLAAAAMQSVGGGVGGDVGGSTMGLAATGEEKTTGQQQQQQHAIHSSAAAALAGGEGSQEHRGGEGGGDDYGDEGVEESKSCAPPSSSSSSSGSVRRRRRKTAKQQQQPTPPHSPPPPQQQQQQQPQQKQRDTGCVAVARCLSLMGGLLVCAAFGLVSRPQLEFWRSNHSFLARGLGMEGHEGWGGDPHDWRLLDIAGEFLVKQGRVEEALPLFRTSVAHMPPLGVKALLNRAKVKVLEGSLGEACEMYETGLLQRHMKNSMHLHNNLALCALRAPDVPLAKRHFQLANDGRHATTPYYTSFLDHNLQELLRWEGVRAQQKPGEPSVGFNGKLMW